MNLRFFAKFLILPAILLLNGCGSSGGGSGSSTPGVPILGLVIENALTGVLNNILNLGSPAVVRAQVRNSNGDLIGNIEVSFTTNQPNISFNPPQASALSDVTGTASIGIEATQVAGAGTITATATVDGQTVTATIGYSVVVPTLSLGSSTDPFNSRVISVSASPVSAGGTTSLSVRLLDQNGQPFLTPVQVNFSSVCAQQNLAVLDSSVFTVNGVATATYRAAGCQGTDSLTASAVFGTQTFTATGSLQVLAASAGSLVFVSSSQNVIGLAGAGGAGISEQAVLTFRALSGNGLPLAGQTVNFALNTTVGGVSLTPTSAISNSDGEVQTVVTSGNILTSVLVTASLPGTGIQTQSSQLAVSTGLPDFNSLSLSIQTLNIESFNIDGVMDPVTIRMADRNNNPPPDGTPVSVTTEGAAIVGSCLLAGGACSVNWVSQSPRPLHLTGEPIADPSPVGGVIFSGNGRSTITATTLGEESFLDLNGNGVFDDGDTFTDIGEPFQDFNEDGVRQANEPFTDDNGNGVFDGPDGFYSGLFCMHSSLCAPNPTRSIFRNGVIVMSTSQAFIEVLPSPLLIDNQSGGLTASVLVWDTNGNMMPAGTTITATAASMVASGTASSGVSNTIAPGPFVLNVPLTRVGTAAGSGTFTVTVTSPGGTVTTGVFGLTVQAVTVPTLTVDRALVQFVGDGMVVGMGMDAADADQTVTLTFLDASGAPVEGATVTATNTALMDPNGNFIVTASGGTTNASGQFTSTISCNGGGDACVGDSGDSVTVIYTASKDGVTASTNVVVSIP